MTGWAFAARRPPRPPGPRGLQTLKYVRLPRLEMFTRLARDYGDIAFLRVGLRRVFFLSHPALVHEVFATQQHRLQKSHGYRKLRILLGRGLITSNGELHASQRRRIRPILSHGEVRQFGDQIAGVADALCASWRDGTARDIHRDMTELTLRALSRTLYSSDIDDHIEAVTEAVRVGTRVLDRWGEKPGIRLLIRLPFPVFIRFRRLLRGLDAWAYAVIQDRKRPGCRRDDAASRIIHAGDPENPRAPVSDRQARDELVTLVMAGHETTASALSFAWHLLAQNPAWEQRLHEELARVLGDRLPVAGDLPQLDVCRRVLAEVLRLCPPVFGLSRLAVEDVHVGGYRIPKGSMICTSQYALGRDERFWHEPDRFDPDRWKRGELEAATRGAYFPFGLAERRCVGEAFFWIEGPTVLATIARRWSLRSAPGEALELRAAVSLRPRSGLRMVPTARRRAPVVI